MGRISNSISNSDNDSQHIVNLRASRLTCARSHSHHRQYLSDAAKEPIHLRLCSDPFVMLRSESTSLSTCVATHYAKFEWKFVASGAAKLARARAATNSWPTGASFSDSFAALRKRAPPPLKRSFARDDSSHRLRAISSRAYLCEPLDQWALAFAQFAQCAMGATLVARRRLV